jgi:thiol-disulfide isomerase/thioredoxin
LTPFVLVGTGSYKYATPSHANQIAQVSVLIEKHRMNRAYSLPSLHQPIWSVLVLFGLALVLPVHVIKPSQAATSSLETTVTLDDDSELGLRVYPATGKTAVIWVAPNYGLHKRHRQVAAELAGIGLEVWQVDLVDSLFLTKSSDSMRKLDGRHVAFLIDHVHHKTGKSIVLLSSYYGAIPTLRGVRAWQQRAAIPSVMDGVILFSPSLYRAVPQLGLEPEFVDVARQTNVPVFVFQPQNNPNRWFIQQTITRLRQGGASVFLQLMPGVTSLFYSADEAAATTRKLQQIPSDIRRTANLLAQLPKPPRASRPASTGTDVPKSATTAAGLNSGLVSFKGDPQPPALRLADVHGRVIERNNFRGKVRLINFWATWCPPCVREIPSLNALQKAMAGKAFEVISVNFAEDPQQVSEFLQRFQVDFPVLLDRDGQVAAQWRVFAFPSTFVIDRQGRIRYGVNAAIHWDSPEVMAQLEALISENP